MRGSVRKASPNAARHSNRPVKNASPDSRRPSSSRSQRRSSPEAARRDVSPGAARKGRTMQISAPKQRGLSRDHSPEAARSNIRERFKPKLETVPQAEEKEKKAPPVRTKPTWIQVHVEWADNPTKSSFAFDGQKTWYCFGGISIDDELTNQLWEFHLGDGFASHPSAICEETGMSLVYVVLFF